MHCEGHILKVDRYQVWGAAPLNAPLHTLLTCRFIKSKRNPPTVVLVRVRASSMMVETPKSPVDIKLQYDQKYFNNLRFFLANFKFLGFKMTDLPTEILPSSARKMLLGLRSLSKLQQTQKEKIIIRNHFYHPVPEFTSNYRNTVIFCIYWCFTVNVLFGLM